MGNKFYIARVEIIQQYYRCVIMLEIICKTCWKCIRFRGENLCKTSLNKRSQNNLVVLKWTDRCQFLLSPGCFLAQLRPCPPSQPMHQDDWSNLSVGLADVWPPSKDSCSCHRAHTPPVHVLGLLCHLLGRVPLSAPHSCVLSMVCNIKHVSDNLWLLLHCSQ